MRGARRDHWSALGPVVEALSFDFYESQANVQAAQALLPCTAHSRGTCNAVAFWFALQLDEETELSTSPYEDKVTCARPLCLLHFSVRFGPKCMRGP
jgi:hypothetical protein